MKFQYSKHKAKWDRIIKHLEKGVKQYKELAGDYFDFSPF